MAYFVEELRAEAERAIAAMRTAAETAPLPGRLLKLIAESGEVAT